MDIYVGYVGLNPYNQLVISVDSYDYDQPEYNCSTAAIVNLEDSHAMAHRHRIKHTRLPLFIAECLEEWHQIINPTFTQVKECFKEITECLLDEGCRFRINRTYGKHAHTCC